MVDKIPLKEESVILSDYNLKCGNQYAWTKVPKFVLTAEDEAIEDGEGFFTQRKGEFQMNILGNSFYLYPIASWKSYLEMEKKHFVHRQTVKKYGKEKREDFEFLKTIGNCNFGKVMQVVKEDLEIYYAAKVYKKTSIVKKGKILQLENELKILKAVKCPFIIDEEYTFQDNAYVFFIVPLCVGGDISTVLKLHHKIPEEVVLYIAAQVALALEYLHYMNVIYRDLKPQNISIDHDGYIKLNDLTLCKSLKKREIRTFTLCGSADYSAPEMMTTCGYNKAVDFWSLGVVVYEMVTGTHPFHDKDILNTCRNIMECKYNPLDQFSEQLQDFISDLLVPNPTNRLGNRTEGIDELKRHEWFIEINWLDLVNGFVKMPYIPNVFTPEDTKCFLQFKEKPLKVEPKLKWFTEFDNIF